MTCALRRIFVAVVALLLALFLLMNALWMIEVPIHLAFGWLWHVGAVVPRATVNMAGVALFAVALPLAAWLAHGSARWLWNDAARPWRWKWTAMGLAAVMLMFVSGVAATGVVHQAGWLIRSPVPLVESSYRRHPVQRVKCASNLKQIAQAIALYQQEGGAAPRSRLDVARLVVTQDLVPDVFVCPASYAEKAQTTRPSDLPAAIDDDRHFSYVVCPEPLPGPGGRVVMYEPLENHEDGLNVLYDDGRAEWLDREAAEAWLATPRAVATQPAE